MIKRPRLEIWSKHSYRCSCKPYNLRWTMDANSFEAVGLGLKLLWLTQSMHEPFVKMSTKIGSLNENKTWSECQTLKFSHEHIFNIIKQC